MESDHWYMFLCSCVLTQGNAMEPATIETKSAA